MSATGKIAITSKEAPAAIGPYTQALRVGDLVFTSGQLGLDPQSGTMVPGGIAEQTERTLLNLQAVLAAAGLDLTHVVKAMIFLKNMEDFAAMNEIYARYLAPPGTLPPARSTVQVAALPKGALVEIDLIARVL